MRVHIVQQGECLSRIAGRYGFTDWRVVYDAPENAELRQLRSNPNVISPGDRVSIPELRPRDHAAPTEQRHRFQVRSRLRFVHREPRQAREPDQCRHAYDL